MEIRLKGELAWTDLERQTSELAVWEESFERRYFV
jgi:hypothetical protein